MVEELRGRVVADDLRPYAVKAIVQNIQKTGSPYRSGKSSQGE